MLTYLCLYLCMCVSKYICILVLYSLYIDYTVCNFSPSLSILLPRLDLFLLPAGPHCGSVEILCMHPLCRIDLPCRPLSSLVVYPHFSLTSDPVLSLGVKRTESSYKRFMCMFVCVTVWVRVWSATISRY